MMSQLNGFFEIENGTKENSCQAVENVAAVFSGKGGTGKTFFAANFAKRYSKNHRVLLVDLDQNLSNINLLLNLTAHKTLKSFFNSTDTFNEVITEYDENLHLILGEAGSYSKDVFNRDQIDRLINQFKIYSDKYDLVVLDIGAGINEENMYAVSKAGIKILVTNPEPTALMDAYVTVKTLANNFDPELVYVVVNRCAEIGEGNLAFNNLKSAITHFLNFRIELLVDIEDSKSVRSSIMSQKLLAQSDETNAVIRSIDIAADRINKINQVFNINHLTYNLNQK
jgi:flagellar biosynthesis protein FlhG